MAMDGLALVHSRTALLDIYLSFFILLATYFFLARWHWWAGIALGLAVATKWSALYFFLRYLALLLSIEHSPITPVAIWLKPTLKSSAVWVIPRFYLYNFLVRLVCK